jgi:hypothetical protein
MSTETKQELAQTAYDKALRYELDFGCCPQCVLAALQETVGGIDDSVIKASHGLSGGGALSGQGACGALTGGLVALSTKRGRDRDKLDKGRFINNFKKGQELVDRFKANSAASPARNFRSVSPGAPTTCGRRMSTRPSTRRAASSARAPRRP